MNHAQSLSQYRLVRLEELLQAYEKSSIKDQWAAERIAAIKAEIKRRRKAMA